MINFNFKQYNIYRLVLALFLGGLWSISGQNVSQGQTSLKLASILGSHMVLQQNAPINIWGEAAAGTKIMAKLGNENRQTITDKEGLWLLTFNARKASFNSIILKVNDLVFNDILVGELWICSGQSNMQFALKKIDTYKTYSQDFSNKNLRFFQEKSLRLVAKNGYTEAELSRCNTQDFFQAKWEVSTKASAAQKSAIAWLFGKGLQQKLDVPVGIIQVAVGGSSLSNWISPHGLKSNPATSHLFDTDWLLNNEVKLAHRDRARAAFKNVLVAGEPYIIGQTPYRWLCEPSFLFEAGIAPLKYLSFKGVLWYQGESDSDNLQTIGRAKVLFPLMINDWRSFFNKKDLPFVFIQLPAYKAEFWPAFRDVQRETLHTTKHTSMVISFDHGAENNIHPKDKQAIGDRAVRLTLKDVYGFNDLIEFPKLESYSVNKQRIKLQFNNIGLGLYSERDTITGFEVANKCGEFKKVIACIVSENTIDIVSSVKKPLQLRYGWVSFPKSSLYIYNSESLPLGPFLIDLNSDKK